MSKQTAVEFLIYWVENSINISTHQQWLDIKDKALAMERKQIMDAHIFAHCEFGGGKIFPSEEEQEELAAEYYVVRFGKEAGV